MEANCLPLSGSGAAAIWKLNNRIVSNTAGLVKRMKCKIDLYNCRLLLCMSLFPLLRSDILEYKFTRIYYCLGKSKFEANQNAFKYFNINNNLTLNIFSFRNRPYVITTPMLVIFTVFGLWRKSRKQIKQMKLICSNNKSTVGLC